MNWYAFNYAIGTMVSFLLGLFVLYRGETRVATRKAWFYLCVFISIWHAGKFVIVTASSEYIARQAVYIIYFGAIFITPCYLRFVLFLLDEEQTAPRLLILSYFLAGLQIVLLLSGWLIAGVRYYPRVGFYEVPGNFYWVYFLGYVSIPTFALLKLTQALCKTDSSMKKNQFKYVITSSLVGFLAGATSYFPVFSFNISPFAAPIVYFYTLPITYAVARYRLLGIDVIIKKSLIYALLLLALLVPCYLIVIWGQVLAFDTINYPFSMSTLLLFIIVGFLFPKLRFKTEDALERALFEKRVDYRDTLLRSSRDMVSIIDLEDLSSSLVRTIGAAFGVEKASLFLLDDVKGVYKLKFSMGTERNHQLSEISLTRNDPLVRGLVGSREGIIREEVEMNLEMSNGQTTANSMNQIDAEISLPILSKDKLIGILNLGRKQYQQIYSHEDIELLSTLANQAAVAIENARLYQNLKQSQDTLRRADRLSSLGLLTAGLAHEIRNPLVAIRTFTQLLPERYEDAEFRNGFQSLALKEVDRICGLITDLLSFARPSRPNVAHEDMNDVIDGIARILDTQAKEKSVELVRDFAPNLPKVWIDREQMKQVFMNLIFNGIQAMNDGGTITISTRIFTPEAIEQSPSFVQVEVKDTGIGIPSENLEHIFDPFFTSKDEGSGLGLSISHQIVQEHGGYVTVESKLGKGTSFLVNIPTGKPVRAMTDRNLHVHEANLSH
jgi:signal transduction histidine kinase